ncbi:MAG: acyl carrier protein [Paludibacter sp.]|nr:acyl carrier protein [Paludibacter sp.]
MEKKILELVNTVLNNRGKKLLKKIKPGMSLRNDLDLDSLDLAELTVRIEVEYDIDIFEDGIVNTVGEIYNKLGVIK